MKALAKPDVAGRNPFLIGWSAQRAACEVLPPMARPACDREAAVRSSSPLSGKVQQPSASRFGEETARGQVTGKNDQAGTLSQPNASPFSGRLPCTSRCPWIFSRSTRASFRPALYHVPCGRRLRRRGHAFGGRVRTRSTSPRSRSVSTTGFRRSTKTGVGRRARTRWPRPGIRESACAGPGVGARRTYVT